MEGPPTAVLQPVRPGSLRLLACLAVAALLALAQFHVRQAVTMSIQYDDAHNANVAKNLAMGFGYSTSYHEIVPFNPEASTGPVVLIPAAALVRLFGNQYWAPTATIVIGIWATLVLVLFLLRPYLTTPEWLGATALIAIGLMLFHNSEFGLLGDVPGAFLACASILLLCGAGEAPRRVLAAGLLLGLAIETKLIAAIVLPSALTYLLLMPAGRVAERPLGRRAADCAAFLVGAIVPFAIWEVWQLIASGSVHDWLDLKGRQYAFIALWSGVGEAQQAQSLATLLLAKVSRNAALLADYFGRWQAFLLFPLGLAVGVGATLLARTTEGTRDRLRAVILVLLGAAVTHVVWWWMLDREGWYRHLLPGILYLLMVSILAAVGSFRVSRTTGATAVALLLLGWSGQFDNFRVVFNSRFQLEPRLQALLATRSEMVELQRQQDILFVGYGWWVPRDLEYAMPTVGNFKDAARLRPEDAAGKRIVLVRNEFFNWEQSPLLRAFQTACDRQVLFTRDPYVISLCPGLPSNFR